MSRHAGVIENPRAAEGVIESIPTISASGLCPAAYSGLIARLFGGAEPMRVVAFTSALPGEGVTYTVTRLAAEVERSTGLRTTILSGSEILSNSGLPSSRSYGVAAASGLARPRLLERLRDQYDVVFVDAGSIARNGTVLGVARMSDAVLIVVQAGRTRRDELAAAVFAVQAAQGKIAGFVLNKFKPALPSWLERLLG